MAMVSTRAIGATLRAGSRMNWRPSAKHLCHQPLSTSASKLESFAGSSLPRIARPSLWTSLVPTFLRRRKPESATTPQKPKGWDPATFFIVIFLFIGSQSIQMIALRNDFTAFSRHAEAKIGLLKEVIERVQRGEDVDVERLLGKGDEKKEREWEDVLREIQEEDEQFQRRSKSGEDASPGDEQPSHASEKQKFVADRGEARGYY